MVGESGGGPRACLVPGFVPVVEDGQGLPWQNRGHRRLLVV